MNYYRQKQILFIGAIDFPHNTSGSNLIRRLFLPLLQKGFSVELLLTRGALDVNNQNKVTRRQNYKGINYTYCSFKKKPRYFFLKLTEILTGALVSSFILLKKLIKKEIDVVVIYTGYPYLNLPIILFARIFRKPVLKISVDWYEKKQVAHKPIYLIKWWLFLFEIQVLDKMLSGIIVLNQKLKEHYIRIGIKKQNILVIPSIIDFNEFKNEPNKNEEYIIGYCGAAPELNGVGDLIDAFSHFYKKYHTGKLYIIGDKVGKGTNLDLFKKQAKQLGVNQHIIFTGRVPFSDVVHYLNQCTVLTLPRKKTNFADSGFPTKLGEYFAMKKPVVLTRVGDFEKYFENKKEVLFCEPNNPISLFYTLSELFENKEMRLSLANSGYHWAKNNIHSEIITEKVNNFFAGFIK